MKTPLAVSILLLVAFCASAANPSFKDFYGTNGILIRTNGNVVQVDGSAMTNAIVTNAFNQNQFQLTGVVNIRDGVKTTNSAQFGTTTNLGSLFMTDVGQSVGYNVSYTATPSLDFVNTFSGVTQFALNESGTTAFDTVPYDFPNAQGAALTFLQNDGSGNLSWGAAGSTNIVQTNRVFVEVNGSDSTGRRNDLTKPFKTVLMGMSNSLPGDVIYVGPGTFLYSNRMVLSNNISIIGTGRKSTIIQNYVHGLHPLFVPNTNTFIGFLQVTNVLQTTTNQIAIGSVDFANPDEANLTPTNVVISNVELFGDNFPFAIFQGNLWKVRLENSFVSGASAVLLTGSSIDLTVVDSQIEGRGASGVLAGTGGIGMDISNTSHVRVYNSTIFGLTNSIVMNDNSDLNLYASFLSSGGSGTNLSIIDPSASELIYRDVKGIIAGSGISTETNTAGFVTVTATGVAGGFITNQYTTNIAGTPVLGSFWFQGTLGDTVTNGSRTTLEYIPSKHSLRMGALGPQASVSNYWDSTNVGVGSVALGSNNLAVSQYSFVQGIFNLIRSNSQVTSITGGSNNIILTNATYSHIGGGDGNDIGDNHIRATIGGGTGNTIDGLAAVGAGSGTISGGDNNRVRLQHGFVGGGANNDAIGIGSTIVGGINNIVQRGDYGFMGGGEANQIAGDWAVMGGGNANIIQAASTGADGLASGIFAGRNNLIGASSLGADYSFIGGGRSNNVPDAADFSVIGGGTFNQTGGGANAVQGNTIAGGFNNLTDDQIDFAAIGGGIKNTVSGDFGFIPGGASNRTTAVMASAIGNFITNVTPASVELGVSDTNKVRVDRTNLWLIGSTKIRMTNGAAAGSVMTSDVNGDATWAAGGGASSPITTNAYTPFPLTLTGTNRIADGAIGNLFSNVFLLGPTETNILADNMREGQTLVLWLYPDTGVTVKFPQFQNASNYTDGGVITLATNIMSRVEITRRGIYTNLVVATRAWEINWGTITASTNFVTGVITLTDTATAGGVTGAVQFNEGNALAGTNRFLYNRAGDFLTLSNGSRTLDIYPNRFVMRELQDFTFGIFNSTNWRISSATPAGSLIPNSTNTVTLGNLTNPLALIYSVSHLSTDGKSSNWMTFDSIGLLTNDTQKVLISSSNNGAIQVGGTLTSSNAVITNLTVLGGALGAGKVLTDVSGNGSATWSVDTTMPFFPVEHNLAEPVIIEDFWSNDASITGNTGAGREAWRLSTAGTVAVTNNTAVGFGVISINPRTTSSRGVYYIAGVGVTGTTKLTNAAIWCQARVMVSDLDGASTGTNIFRMGFGDVVSAENNNGIVMRSTNNVWQLVTSRNGVSTVVNSISNVVEDVWQYIGWHLDDTGTNVYGYVGTSPTNMAVVATNNLTIPHDFTSFPIIGAIHGLTNSTFTTGVTNFIDSYKVWVRHR